MRVSQELPDPARQELQALLRQQGEAVRPDLQSARRERVEAWRAMARGEAGAEETERRLEAARLRELAARRRMEAAVSDWAARQSPEVRALVAEALAREAAPGGERPLRPPGPRRPPPFWAPRGED